MPASPSKPITTYQTSNFLEQFMPDASAFKKLRMEGSEWFFIVAVEQMYAQFKQAIPPSRSTAHSLLYLTSGAARMRIGNEQYTIRQHELLLVRAGQLYSFEPGDENTGFLIHFRHDMLRAKLNATDTPLAFGFLEFWGRPFIALDAETAGFVEDVLRRLLAEYNARELQYPDILRAYLLALLHELNRAYVATPVAPQSTALVITNRFKQLVATSLKSAHSVRDYASLLHITPNHLTKSVRSVTGKAPAKWLEESIVLEAKALLFQSTLAVSEIALEVGVADPSYFSRLFKKHTGMSPLAFRRMIGKS
ncbi:helix-turn-helix domain-containing protein [Hymenobacter sp. BT186]|uniref:Helix-turn-helix domain-containing protein n=1 Tax=Hymenobacter telluris TaxID=2816474 RepID=A0A939EW21_9BACT|nr:AraC family transcriptional regulator [Hymenobacter telluris]MBO0358086.1 helix-turn-helix domain-containing protein [Hymenobacter telluris]MBW3374113.1 AraC family transcriptional regulator [Hymenobacter norwichensis]